MCGAGGRAAVGRCCPGPAAAAAVARRVPRASPGPQRGAPSGRQSPRAGASRPSDRLGGGPSEDRRLGDGGLCPARHRHDGHGAAHARHLHGGAHPHAADLRRRQDRGGAPHGPHRRGGGRGAAAHDAHGCPGRGRQRLLVAGGRRRQGAHARELCRADGYALRPDLCGRRGGHGHRERPAARRGQAQRNPLPASEGPQRRRPVPHVAVPRDRRGERRAARADRHALAGSGSG